MPEQNTRRQFYDFLAGKKIKLPDYESFSKALDDTTTRRGFYEFLSKNRVKMPGYDVYEKALGVSPKRPPVVAPDEPMPETIGAILEANPVVPKLPPFLRDVAMDIGRSMIGGAQDVLSGSRRFAKAVVSPSSGGMVVPTGPPGSGRKAEISPEVGTGLLQMAAGGARAGFGLMSVFDPALMAFQLASPTLEKVPGVKEVMSPVSSVTQPTSEAGKFAAELGDVIANLGMIKGGQRLSHGLLSGEIQRGLRDRAQARADVAEARTQEDQRPLTRVEAMREGVVNPPVTLLQSEAAPRVPSLLFDAYSKPIPVPEVRQAQAPMIATERRVLPFEGRQAPVEQKPMIEVPSTVWGSGQARDIVRESAPEKVRATQPATTERTAEDYELHPDQMKEYPELAVRYQGKTYRSKYGEKGIYNHADLVEKNNLMGVANDVEPGFINKNGEFVSQGERKIEPAQAMRSDLPEFKTTNEALEFGKANPDAIDKLQQRRDHSLALAKEAQSKGRSQEALNASFRAQFDREAMEEALKARKPSQAEPATTKEEDKPVLSSEEQTKTEAQKPLAEASLDVLPKEMADQVKTQAQAMYNELSGSIREFVSPIRRAPAEDPFEGGQVVGYSKGGVVSTFPEWFSKLGRTKDDVMKNLKKIIDDDPKNELAKQLKDQIEEHLEFGQEHPMGFIPPNEAFIDAKAKAQGAEARVNVPPPTEVQEKVPAAVPPLKQETQPTIEGEKAGTQGILLTEQAKYPRPSEGIRSDIPASEQIKGTMFEKEVPDDTQGALLSSVIPGAQQFLEQDVVPKARQAFENIAKSADSIRKILAPASRGEYAQQAAASMRIGKAGLAQKREIVNRSFDEARKAFDSMPKEKNLAFIDGVETGKLAGDAEEQATARLMRDMLNDRFTELNKRGLLSSYIVDYFPHLWKDPEKAGGQFTGMFSRRPLEGTKSFLKKRIIPSVKEGMSWRVYDADGNLLRAFADETTAKSFAELSGGAEVYSPLEPISTNPVELVAAQLNNMDKLIMATDFWNELKARDIPKFVPAGGEVPQGYARVNDKIARVFQRSELEKGFLLRGEYWLPEQAARIINNDLSSGLQSSALYQGFRMLGNTLNQVQLGMSAFHLGFTSVDASVSKFALGIQLLSQGRPIDAAVKVAQTPIAPIENYIRGNKLLQDYYARNPETPELVNALIRAGGRVRMDAFYKNSAVESFWKAVRSGNYPGSIFRAPSALLEYGAKPIMEVVVPRQKLGVFADMAKYILEDEASGKLTKDQATRRLQEAWDSVDNRMGQLVYDNLFWNRTLKDLGLIGVRSLGWNLGTFRELGGAGFDVVRQTHNLLSGDPARVTPKMAYALALPSVVGIAGAMLGYLYTGEGPKELKDYYFPKTGRKNPDGTEERVSIASYMKDLYAYKEQPLTTLEHKIHPFASAFSQMLNNRDFFGTQIRNSEDPMVQQMKDVGEFWAKQFVPFSVQFAAKRKEAGGTLEQQAESFFGITPAPKYIDQTDAQKTMSKILGERGQFTSTKEGFEKRKLRNDFARKILSETVASEDMQKAVESGLVDSDGQIESTLTNRLFETPNQSQFAKLRWKDAIIVWKKMSRNERSEVSDIMANKLDRLSTEDFKVNKQIFDEAERLWKDYEPIQAKRNEEINRKIDKAEAVLAQQRSTGTYGR